MIRKKVIMTIFFMCYITILTGCGAQQFKTDVFQNFYSEGWGPTAMTTNGRELIIGEDTIVMELYSIETDLYISESYPYNGNGFFRYSRQPQSIRTVGKISGLAWESACCSLGYLWVADSVNNQIVKLSQSNEAIKIIPTTGFVPQGLAFDGKNLWTADMASGKIYNLDSENGIVLNVYASPVDIPVSLAYDCDNLIILGFNNCKKHSECVNKRIVKMNTQTGKLIEEINIPRQMKRPVAIAVDKDKLWVGDKELNRVFKIDNSGNAISEAERSYLIAKTPPTQIKPRKIEIVDKPNTQDIKKSVDEAKDAAERAKKSADEAKDAAERAKKAFELQQKK